MIRSERILILGLGGIGYYLAKRLAHDGHAITAIESDAETVLRADADIDARTVHGNALTFSCWKGVAGESFDYLIAVTDSDAVNITASLIAHRCGVQQKIARIRSLELWRPDALLRKEDLHIDLMIRPAELTALEIARLLEVRSGNMVIDIDDGEMQVLEIPVTESSPLCRKTLIEAAQLHDAFRFRIVAIARGIQTIIPGGHDVILPNDHIFVLAHQAKLPDLMALAGLSDQRRHRVMIIGGGLIGQRTAQLLEQTHPVTLIERDEKRAEELSCLLDKTQCLHGDGADAETLIQAGLLEADTIITATSDNETNIMTGVLAKHLLRTHGDSGDGDGKTIVLVKREEYVALASSMGADIVLNSKVLAGNEILKHIRRGQLLAVAHLHGCDAEVLELVAEPDAPITRRPLQDVSGLKGRILIGGVYREGVWRIAVGSTRIAAGEKVIAICSCHDQPHLQRLFLS